MLIFVTWYSQLVRHPTSNIALSELSVGQCKSNIGIPSKSWYVIMILQFLEEKSCYLKFITENKMAFNTATKWKRTKYLTSVSHSSFSRQHSTSLFFFSSCHSESKIDTLKTSWQLLVPSNSKHYACRFCRPLFFDAFSKKKIFGFPKKFEKMIFSHFLGIVL